MSAKTFTRTVEKSADGERLFILVDNIILMAQSSSSRFKEFERVKVRIDTQMQPRYIVSSTASKYSETFWYNTSQRRIS